MRHIQAKRSKLLLSSLLISNSRDNRDFKPIDYPPPQAPLSTDILTSVSLTGTNHAEDQPVHLQLPYAYADVSLDSASGVLSEAREEVEEAAADVERKRLANEARAQHVKTNIGEYAGLLGRACPAAVYEYVDSEDGEEGSWQGKKLVINSQASTFLSHESQEL